MFKSIEIRDWRQFKFVSIDFHRRLTILTGANGAGKTTILNLLNRHFGWGIGFVGTPRKTRRGLLRYFTDFALADSDYDEFGSPGPKDIHVIGSVTYEDGATASLTVPKASSASYQVDIRKIQSVNGLFVPSHRPVYSYQRIREIPTTVAPDKELFQGYVNEIRTHFLGGSSKRSAGYKIKESLISLATFGYGNEAVLRNEDAVRTFEEFQAVLRIVLPPSLGFQYFSIRLPEVVLVTSTGDISLDAVSGGISAIIDAAWQFYMASRVFGPFVAIIDEPENHLHPTLQRSFLPTFLEAFSNVQIIAATHNPFMVSSVRDSNVYVLDYEPSGTQRRVVSHLLDMVNKAGTSAEILREVLGLDTTKPAWVEDELNRIIDRWGNREVDASGLASLKAELKTIGLDEFFSEASSKLLGDRR